MGGNCSTHHYASSSLNAHCLGCGITRYADHAAVVQKLERHSAAQAEVIAELVGVLCDLQSISADDVLQEGSCPCCYGCQGADGQIGHAPDCRLSLALARAKRLVSC